MGRKPFDGEKIDSRFVVPHELFQRMESARPSVPRETWLRNTVIPTYLRAALYRNPVTKELHHLVELPKVTLIRGTRPRPVRIHLKLNQEAVDLLKMARDVVFGPTAQQARLLRSVLAWYLEFVEKSDHMMDSGVPTPS